MSIRALHSSARTSARGRTPALLNGDHLTVPEFERRYEAAPASQRAELIEGIVFMSPPISNLHSDGHGLLYLLLKHYALATPRVGATLCASLRLDGQNEYQPDATLRIKSGALARSKIASDGFLEGAPEFAAEIAVSSAGYDLHEKKAVYQRCQIREYLVWQVMDSKIHWFSLEDGQYVQLQPLTDGVICSHVFPGLWLNFPAMLAGADDKALRTLEKGLKSAEHKTFVRKLSAKNA
jgi:hypothetical protein